MKQDEEFIRGILLAIEAVELQQRKIDSAAHPYTILALNDLKREFEAFLPKTP